MKNVFKQAQRVLLVFFFLFPLNSCDQIVDEILDCVINRGPVLSKKIFQGGYLGEFYSEYVRAEVQNDPSDNAYDYYFDVFGSLPAGIEVVYEYRKVTFQGVPVELGNFEVTVTVYVEGPEDWDEETDSWDDDLCYHTYSDTYTIRIHERKQ